MRQNLDVSKERRLKAQEEKFYRGVGKRCWAEIEVGQIERNFNAYLGALPRGFDIIPVIKADAYGHGAGRVAERLSTLGVRCFAVATLGEGIRLRESGISQDILILGYTPPCLGEEIYSYGLTQTLTDAFYAEELASASGKRLRAQYAVDTGMRRVGLDGYHPVTCERAIRRGAELFDICGIFTHLSSADGRGEEDAAFTRAQITRFAETAERVADMRLPYVHCLNTAGGLLYAKTLPEGIGKTVRLGISLYGVPPSDGTALPNGILPALSWYATVASVRAVKKGETVGYGADCVMDRDCIIATLSVGYADGYSRAASFGRGYALINGQRAPVVGRVCMDQTMVDVSRHRHVRTGDRVTLIGSDGGEKITADGLGRMFGAIGYETLCGISSRVERIYI